MPHKGGPGGFGDNQNSYIACKANSTTKNCDCACAPRRVRSVPSATERSTPPPRRRGSQLGSPASVNGEPYGQATSPASSRRATPADRVEVQETAFSIDVPGRYVCSTWDEATNNGGVQFDVVVIGAGMFGAYCAEKIYRNSNLRVLVLDAGSFLVLGARAESRAHRPQRRRRSACCEQPGGPWHARTRVGHTMAQSGRIPGPCLLHWGSVAVLGRMVPSPDAGGSLRALAARTRGVPSEREPKERRVRADGEGDRRLRHHRLYQWRAVQGTQERDSSPSRDAGLPNGLTVDAIEDAPLAVQGAAPASGLFSFDKFSSAPILADAIREAAGAPDWSRRLFLVPRAHVVRLDSTGQDVTRLEAYVGGQQRFLDVPPTTAIVLACGTIESTRLALESFETPLMGRNLVAHLRSNTTVRIKRAAFDPGLPQRLEAAALLVRGSKPGQRFHLQVTAAAVTGADPEVAMFRMIPDIDLLDRMLASEDADAIVITFRGIGEMQGTPNADALKVTGATPSWVDLSDQRDEFGMRRAWVNLVPTPQDLDLWRTMDDTAIAFAQTLAGKPENIEYFYNKDGSLNAPGAAWHAEPPPPSTSNDRNDPANKVRDGLGTTHHEAGTLWMGTDPSTSVTDLNGRFHHRSNVYVAGPALFPAIGSANPSLTALTLARRTADAIVTRSFQLRAWIPPHR